MTNNVNSLVTIAPTYTYWTALSGNYPYGTTGTIANGSSSGMGRLKGVSAVKIPMPAAPAVNVAGDNGVITQFILQPAELPNGTLSLVILDQDYAAKANGVKVYADGDWDEVGDGPACYTFADLGFVFNCPANSQDSGSVDEAGWNVYELYKVQVQASIFSAMQTGTAVTLEDNVRCKRASASFAGRTFSVANDGATSFVVKQYWSSAPVKYHTLIGNAVATTITLDETPVAASAAAVQVWINGVKKAYTTDYTVDVTTKVVTLVAAPAAAAIVIVKYKHVATC